MCRSRCQVLTLGQALAILYAHLQSAGPKPSSPVDAPCDPGDSRLMGSPLYEACPSSKLEGLGLPNRAGLQASVLTYSIG